MTELLHNLWDDVWYGDWTARVIALTVVGVMLVCAALLVAVVISLYYEIDSWSLTEGTVIAKDYDPAWTEIQTHCYPIGNSQHCQTIPIHHPESWSVTIEGIDPEGEHKTRTVRVSEQQYEELAEGQHYAVEKR